MIIKFDKAILELTNGVYSTQKLTMYADDLNKVNEIGV
jgi:hypothetical protein